MQKKSLKYSVLCWVLIAEVHSYRADNKREELFYYTIFNGKHHQACGVANPGFLDYTHSNAFN